MKTKNTKTNNDMMLISSDIADNEICEYGCDDYDEADIDTEDKQDEEYDNEEIAEAYEGCVCKVVDGYDPANAPHTDAEYEAWLHANGRMIHKLAHKYTVVTKESEEDLFQEGCIAVHNAVSHYSADRKTGFNTYAYRCVENCFKMIARTQSAKMRTADVVSLDESISPSNKDGSVSLHNAISAESADPTACSTEEKGMLRAAYSMVLDIARTELSDVEYKCLIASLNGEKQKDIAEALGISPTACSKLIRSAHSTLIWALKERNVNHLSDLI